MTTKGKPKSPEHRERIAAAMRGRTLSPEHRAALRKPKSPQHRAKISAAMRARSVQTVAADSEAAHVPQRPSVRPLADPTELATVHADGAAEAVRVPL